MKPPSTSGISAEELEGDDAIPRLLQGLNPFMGHVTQALSGQLGWENFRAELKTLDVKVPEPAWIAPTLQNSWAAFGGGFETPGYRIDSAGRVFLRGLVASGTGFPTTILDLPVGYRPSENTIVATASNNAHGTLLINSSGVTAANSGSTTWFSLACSFQATSPTPPAAFTSTGWPLLFSTKVADPRLVIPVAVQDAQASANTTFGGPTLDWERTGDGRIKVKSIHGLTPGRAYKLTVLVTGG